MFSGIFSPLPAMPQRPPTCWEFFGFDGPTNKHNLDLRYRERINAIVPAGAENAFRAAFVRQQYKTCLREIED